MAKNKQLKQVRQMKFDKIMLLVGIVSVFGGFLVFTSYAARKVNTVVPGVVSVNSLPKSGVFYEFSLEKSLEYCFGAPDPQERAKVEIYNNKKLVATHDISEGCFSPKKSYETPVLTISGVSQESSLKISKQ